MSVGTQMTSETGGSAEPTSADVMEAIKGLKDTVMVKIDCMATDIGLIHHDMDKFRSRISERSAFPN